MSGRRWPRRLLKGVLIIAGVWLALEAAWWAMWRTRIDQRLANADRVEVRVDGRISPLVEKQITDPAAIARIRAYIEARPGRWTKTWHTPAVTHVHVAFFRDSSLLGWFAAGANFLQTRASDGAAAERNASPAELEELNRLLGVPAGSHHGQHRHRDRAPTGQPPGQSDTTFRGPSEFERLIRENAVRRRMHDTTEEEVSRG